MSDAARPQIEAAETNEIAKAPPPIAAHQIPHPEHAVAELAVLTNANASELAKLVDPKARARLVLAKYCGDKATCDAVRAFASDKANVAITIEKADGWGVPKADALPFVAQGLSQAQRDAIPSLPHVIALSAHGTALPNQLPARAAFAMTAAIADRLHAVVYDETLRRIETSDAFGAHAITSALGATAFREDRIVIQLYRQDDGSARLLTLGMRRFGAADLEIEGASEGAENTLTRALDAIAAQLAAGANQTPLRAGASDESDVGFALSPHHEGDPDNTFLRVTTRGGITAKGYDDLAAAIDGRRDETVDEGPHDAALAAAAVHARIAFPAALAKWRSESARAEGSATLMVKLPFDIGTASDAASNDGDGGGVEAMWVNASHVDDDAIAGSLANNPVYATSLHAGSQVRGKRSALLDYVLTLEDGGTEGGESMLILEGRAR